MERDGKNIITVDKFVEDKQVSYLLRLKEEIPSQIGDRVRIDKDNILSMKVIEKRQEENPVDKGRCNKAFGPRR